MKETDKLHADCVVAIDRARTAVESQMDALRVQRERLAAARAELLGEQPPPSPCAEHGGAGQALEYVGDCDHAPGCGGPIDERSCDRCDFVARACEHHRGAHRTRSALGGHMGKHRERGA